MLLVQLQDLVFRRRIPAVRLEHYVHRREEFAVIIINPRADPK